MNKDTSSSITMLNLLTQTDVPFETDEANILFGTNAGNFSLKKAGLESCQKLLRSTTSSPHLNNWGTTPRQRI